jgi:alpha-1,2-mannosyltransferase
MLSLTLYFIIYGSLFLALYILLVLLVRWKLKRSSPRGIKTISFLHPYSYNNGGGEKVLWMMVKQLSQMKAPNVRVKILSYNPPPSKLILENLRSRFDIAFDSKYKNIQGIDIVPLKQGYLLTPLNFLTMFFQIVGQIFFAIEIITTIHSDVIIDTTGLPFTYFVLNILGGSEIYSYVHYPFISNDMLSDIRNGVQGVHSRGALSRFKLSRNFKLIYYNLILLAYRFMGVFVKAAFANSTWTLNHMQAIWPGKMTLLYPPCNVSMYNFNIQWNAKEDIIVSFAQFRPEKRHKMQIEIIERIKTKFPNIKLFMIGSTRNKEDEELLRELQTIIHQKGLANNIFTYVNQDIESIKQCFKKAKIGIHTMRDEHFGITIIEMMAAGLITIAHKSAGAKDDIIGPSPRTVGSLAEGILDFIFRY